MQISAPGITRRAHPRREYLKSSVLAAIVGVMLIRPRTKRRLVGAVALDGGTHALERGAYRAVPQVHGALR